MGITGIVGSYTTTYGGTPGPAPQRPARRRADRRRAGRARRAVLVQRDDRRAQRGEGVRGGAGDHQRRARERDRRRRLPGLDDRVQRGLRGRPLDREAHEPRALHQPLPARPRRDRELPRPRPRVHERHRQVAARAYVRRRGLAHGQPLRNAAGPPGRDRDGAARGRREGAVEADRRRHALQGGEGRRAVGIAAALDERHAGASTRPTAR